MAMAFRRFSPAQLRAIFSRYKSQGIRPGAGRLKAHFFARQRKARTKQISRSILQRLAAKRSSKLKSKSSGQFQHEGWDPIVETLGYYRR